MMSEIISLFLLIRTTWAPFPLLFAPVVLLKNVLLSRVSLNNYDYTLPHQVWYLWHILSIVIFIRLLILI